jgi:molecular chaperone GrpE
MSVFKEPFMQDEQPNQDPLHTPASEDAASAASTPYEELSIEERLAKVEALAQENHDHFLRAKAETDNVRKRASADLQQARKFALESFAAELVTVKDSLEAALTVQQSELEAYRNGVELTLRQLSSVFEKFNVLEISPVGEKFDPNRHQAISALESDELPNTVLSVMQKGYALHERILRPAFVTVANAKPETPPA